MSMLAILLVLVVLSALSALSALAEVVAARQLRTDLTSWCARVQARHNSEVTHGT